MPTCSVAARKKIRISEQENKIRGYLIKYGCVFQSQKLNIEIRQIGNESFCYCWQSGAQGFYRTTSSLQNPFSSFFNSKMLVKPGCEGFMWNSSEARKVWNEELWCFSARLKWKHLALNLRLRNIVKISLASLALQRESHDPSERITLMQHDELSCRLAVCYNVGCWYKT